MRFRTRLLTALLLTVFLPGILLAWYLRNEYADQVREQYRIRAESQQSILTGRVLRNVRATDRQLRSISRAWLDDNTMRSELARTSDENTLTNSYLLDAAPRAAALSGLTFLQLLSPRGSILSSAHYRNDAGRQDSGLASMTRNTDHHPLLPTVVWAQLPTGPQPAFVRVDSFSIASETWFIVGGTLVSPDVLEDLLPAPGNRLCLDFAAQERNDQDRLCTPPLLYPVGSQTAPADSVSLEFPSSSPFETAAELAHLTLVQDRRGLTAELERFDRSFLLTISVLFLLALMSLVWVANRFSRPLADLVYKTSRIDLDRLNVQFRAGRTDEIGDLSRVLRELVFRLRRSSLELRQAERNLTIGEVARQVNHDIRNGLAPIRNIIAHIRDTADEQPEATAEVVRERYDGLLASLNFLDELSSNYARLTPEASLTTTSLDVPVHQIVQDYSRSRGVSIAMDLNCPSSVRIDELGLRRMLENLLDNSFASLPRGQGNVTVTTTANDRAMLAVADSGAGMSEVEQESAFRDFHTTRKNGIGLGLSIVRRLAMDMNASLEIDSSPGKGTTISVAFPVATPDSNPSKA